MNLSGAPPVLLAFILSAHLGAATRDSDIAKSCCFNYGQKMLPWTWVQNKAYTSDNCPKHAVIFTTKRGERVCAHPEEKWVQRYISLLVTQKQ
ncbi:C-C motif chemokine 26 [Eulemur rufifrons]|uniref:C-C motif chemokine 26 n=1 Tax=Eulemur rufifrons TaxID=859984 RepID=UPI003742DE49